MTIATANFVDLDAAYDDYLETQADAGIELIVRTRSGVLHDLFSDDLGPFDYHDAVHGLSRLNRYIGQFPFSFSVLTHSCLCADLAGDDRALAYALLMHDFAEHLIGDMPGPIKRFDPFFRALERRVRRPIDRQFGVPTDADIQAQVHRIDHEQCERELKAMDCEGAGVPKWDTLRAKVEFGLRFFALAPEEVARKCSQCSQPR